VRARAGWFGVERPGRASAPEPVGVVVNGSVGTRSISVLVVDDQELIRSALVALLDGADGLEVTGEAQDGHQALALAARLRPDVVLTDIRMPIMDGLELTRRLRALDVPPSVVVLTTYDLDEYVFDAVRAGACGFLLKDSKADDLIRGVRLAATGEAMVEPAALSRLLGEFGRRRAPDERAASQVLALSPREREVLVLMARGCTNSEIAERLVISETTAKTHVSHVLHKLDCRDRVQAVITAYESGLVVTGS
jgi:DNA-binding NarL/FixJ family response regulator